MTFEEFNDKYLYNQIDYEYFDEFDNDCNKYRKVQEDLFEQALAEERKKFAEWLSKQAYLCVVQYYEDEDFEGNITLNVQAENLDVDEVLNQYEREHKND